jgi:hypothetical protein
MTIWQPNANQFERLRLILSTYQDGTGWEGKGALPGYRQIERAVALAFGGQAGENKGIYDVLLPNEEEPPTEIGLSCKMRSELNRVARDGRVTIEVSNSAGEFWRHLNSLSINQTNYRNYPSDVGAGLLHVVEQWHLIQSTERGGLVKLDRSSYLVLLWNRVGVYQLFQFALSLPDPANLNWSFPLSKKGDKEGRRIIGETEMGLLFEWYGESGGQLKYYPFATDAIWSSQPFQLEPLPTGREYGILLKASDYFPDQWAKVAND